MSRYNDPLIRDRARQLNGRVMRAIRQAKRMEAEERNARTPQRRRRAYREGRQP